MTSALLQEWFEAGDRLDVPGTAGTRIWRQGEGETVVCLHGVPSSAYLYRKVLPALAERGLEGVALDLQGLGFSDRPRGFDYTWTGLSGWLEQALDAAGIVDYHLVVHDLGGPIGFDLVRRAPQRVRSLTALNTVVEVADFRPPWIMRPFAVPVLGPLMVAQMNSPAGVGVLRWKGMSAGPDYAELRTYGELLWRGDRGRAFLEIMRSFETTEELEARITGPLARRAFPAQVVWGRDDTELPADTFGESVRRVLGLEHPVQLVDGKHFVQETSPVEIAERVALLVAGDEDR